MNIKRLLVYLLPAWKTVILAFLVLVGATVGDLSGPYLTKIFIDDYLVPRNLAFTPILNLVLIYFGLLLGGAVLYYFQIILFNKLALQVIKKLRTDVFNNVQDLGLSYFDKTPTGEIISRITNDTEAVKELFVQVLGFLVQNMGYIISIFAAMFLLDVQLAFLTLFLLPVILLLMYAYSKISSKIYKRIRESLSQINTKLSESLQGMNLIQAMSQEKRFKKEFEEINGGLFAEMKTSVKVNAFLLRSAVSLLYSLAIAFALSYFGLFSLENTVQLGVIIAFFNYLDRIFEPISMIMERLSVLQQANVAGGRVFELIDKKEYASHQEEQSRGKIQEGLVEFKNVSFAYEGTEKVLHEISFTARPGETVALVGHTGSGKSSISNLLMGFYPWQEGEISIDGYSIKELGQELREKVGLVLQEPFIFYGTVADNISLKNKEFSKEDIVEAAKLVEADKFIEKLTDQYEEILAEGGSNLSTGQRQLLCFARTMLLNPKILILDEATANIDTETEEIIQEALAKMQQGRTTIAIAHRLSTIQEADKILVLNQGRIVETGHHEELLKKQGLYYKMYLMQQGKDNN